MLEVVCIPVLQDNYVWLVRDGASTAVAVVDPAVDQPVLDAAAERGWTISQIWNTHWHPDHCDGNAAIKSATNCVIHAPTEERGRGIADVDRRVGGGEVFDFGGHVVRVIAVPGHTLGHVAYYLPNDGIVFTGDTLFAAGCGKVFEGTAEQMWSSLRKLMELPGQTRVYAAHEYTMSNLRFARTVDPDNDAIVERMQETSRMLSAGRPSLPTTISQEKLTNPFCRAGSAEDFARVRRQKDLFR